ncbi:hypothetical protein [Desulfoluna sp.]|uniref:hypothetical protein n=1 Tax=Desulfoluna sp. TaxID=2045199 RepID=UPI00261E94C1|nr:hypothetical protein [Desulfoluna sp.]
MNELFGKPFRKLLIFLPVLILMGCAGAKQPIFLSSTFGQEMVENILVLPIVDLRFNKEPELPKLDKWVQRVVKGKLKYKKYTFTLISDLSIVDNITEEDLKEVDAEWVKNLGPSGSRWIIIVALLDAKSKLTFGCTGNAEISGYLIDKKEGSILWRDKGIGKTGYSGLGGMLMKGFMLEEAIKMASVDLMKSFPKNKI